MRPEQKTKSRTKLYQALEGAKELTGAAGQSAIAAAVFADNPTEGEVFTFFDGTNTTTFTFWDSGNEPGTDATVEVTIGAGLTNTIDNLIADILANTTTGAWGVLHPIDATALVNTGGTTLTVTLFPGSKGNSVVLSGTAAALTGEPFAATGGVAAPVISPDVNANIIDTTGSAANKEYYVLKDGSIGQEVKVLVKTFAASDTPTIVGKLKEDGVAMVEAEFVTAEPGAYVTFMWDGSYWSLTGFSALCTVPDFSASA